MEEKYIQMIIENKDSCKSAHHRIDNIDAKVEDIHELTTSVKLLASEMKAMHEDMNDMNNRLKTVEEKPR